MLQITIDRLTKNPRLFLASILIFLIIIGVRWAKADSHYQAGLVINHGDGRVTKQCVSFDQTSFAEICSVALAQAATVATHSPTPPGSTLLLQPNSPLSTPTTPPITPTATLPPSPIISFTADSPTLNAGGCTTLRWNVQHATTVQLDGITVGLQGLQQICPPQSQTFSLQVDGPGGQQISPLTIQVIQPAPQPDLPPTSTVTPTPAPQPAAPPLATATHRIISTLPLAPTATPTGTLLIRLELLPTPNPATQAMSQAEAEPLSLQDIFVYGGIVSMICLVLAIPLSMLGLGWLAIWLQRLRQNSRF